MNAAGRNAERLCDDASLLLQEARYPSAAALAALSIEEAGKLSILRRLAVARDEEEVAECWRNYRWHTKKNIAWLLPQLVADGARRLDDFSPLFDGESDHPELLDQVKQISFYSDCLGNRHWSEPEDVVDKELATSLVKTAQILVPRREVSKKEIELWIKHLKPVWNLSDKLAKQALEDWYEDMQRHGLAAERRNRMRRFIRTGFQSHTDPRGQE
jgi:AbiV family abortive infection protein